MPVDTLPLSAPIEGSGNRPTRISVLFKSKVRELQRPAVFGYVADELVAGSLGKVGVDFDGDLDFRSDQAGQVLDNFLGDPGSVAAQAEWVNGNRSVKPP